MREGFRRGRPTGRPLLFAASVALFWFVLFNCYQLVEFLIRMPGENDFRFFWTGAVIGLTHGWSRIYDPHLQASLLHDPLPFVNPPPLAWLVVPLTALPFPWAFGIWMALVLGALVVASWAFDRRLIHVASALGLLPSFYAVSGGQVAPLLLAVTVGAAALLRRNRQLLAGVLLSVFIIKPHLGLLLFPVLLAAGYYRAALAHGVAMAGWAAASAWSLGVIGLADFKNMVVVATGPLETQWSLTRLGIPGVALMAVLIGVALVGARRRPKDALAIALLGSLVANVHLTPSDFVLMLPAIWSAPAAIGAALWLAVWFAPAFGLPVMVMAPLALIAAAAERLRLAWLREALRAYRRIGPERA